MLQRLQKSMSEKDKGFTLIELLVVIVIIGILAGIAIPVFLNQRKKGVDAGVESDLKALATIQETVFVDKNAYSTTVTDLKTAGWNPTEGNKIDVALMGTDGYCIKGSNQAGNAKSDSPMYYSSGDGGLSEAAKTKCAASGLTYVAVAS